MKRTLLAEVLENLKMAVSTSIVVPQLNNITFVKKKIRSYNDIVGIEYKADDLVIPEGFGVFGRTLIELIRNSLAPDVDFAIEGEFVRVKAGRSDIKLPHLTEDECIFADPDPKKKPLIDTELTKELLDGITACQLTTARDTSLPALMGVNFKSDAIYSCDGDAISRYTFKTGLKDGVCLTIPNQFCDVLIKLTDKLEPNGCTMTVDDDWAVARLTNGYSVYGRMIKIENQIDHATLIKDTIKGKPFFVQVPQGLAEALARARVLADRLSSHTRANIANGRLTLVTSTPDGVLRDLFNVAKGHPDVEANFSAKAMQRSISVCDQLAVFGNCTVYQKGNLFSVLANMDDKKSDTGN